MSFGVATSNNITGIDDITATEEDEDEIIYDEDASLIDASLKSPKVLAAQDIGPMPILGRALCCAPCFDIFEDDNVVGGNAFDIVMVKANDGTIVHNSDFLVTFDKKVILDQYQIILEVQNEKNNNNNNNTNGTNNTNGAASNYDNDTTTNNDSSECDTPLFDNSTPLNNKPSPSSGATTWFPLINVESADPSIKNNNNKNDNKKDQQQQQVPPAGFDSPEAPSPGILTDLNGSSDASEVSSKLASILQFGRNPIRYLLLDKQKVIGIAHASIFLWSAQDRVVVSDIDGTITKSNVRGVVDTILTNNYQHCHEGVCNFLSSIVQQKPNTQVLYLTSRPIVFATATRNFLAGVTQTTNASLPLGPLLGFGGNVPQLLLMELLSKNTHTFKASTLWNQVVVPFQRVQNDITPQNLFVAGFGNSLMDVQAYHMIGIGLSKIYLINKQSRITSHDKEKLEINASITMTKMGDPMPRAWYKSQLGSTFSGYADVNLPGHVHADKEQYRRSKRDLDTSEGDGDGDSVPL